MTAPPGEAAPGAAGPRAARIDWLESHGTALALHGWADARAHAVVFYVHGIQSHAGWLFETGPALRAQGVATYVLDRRGSGQSGGPRGDVPSLRVLLDDYTAALARVRALHPDLPVTLVGQSLGGAIAAGIAVDGRAALDAIALCAPALGQQRAKLSDDERAAIRRDRSGAPVPVRLRDEDYTREPAFLDFLRRDELTLRAQPQRTRAVLIDLEDFYLSRASAWPRCPTAFVAPRTDAIIRLGAAREAFALLTAGRGLVIEFPVDDHYLEFSRHRDAFRRWLAGFAAARGYGMQP